MAVAELQKPSKSGRRLPDRCGVCAMTLSAAEKARAQKKRDVFRRLLDCLGFTPYYAVSEALFRVPRAVGWLRGPRYVRIHSGCAAVSLRIEGG